MARFQSPDPPVRKRERLPARRKGAPTAKMDEFGEDPWAVGKSRTAFAEPSVKPSSAVEAAVKPEKKAEHSSGTDVGARGAEGHSDDEDDNDDDEDDVALPTPIAATVPLGKIVTPDGRELPFYHEIPSFVYRPLPGFEHCLPVPVVGESAQGTQETPSSRRASKATRAPARTQGSQPHGVPPVLGSPHTSLIGAAYAQSVHDSLGPHTTVPRTSNIASGSTAAQRPRKGQPLKRSRSVAQGLVAHRTARNPSEDDDVEDEEDDKDVRVTTEPSYSFYIGNFDDLKKFFRRRFEELTTRPLRPIVTAWIKQLEPRRLGGYGPYHKQLPSEQPPECTPPWWPRNVPYNEPSHLSKANLQILAIDVMLQHRQIDVAKRKGSWVGRLQQAAEYAVEMTPPDLFSSSKRPDFSEKMKDRALSYILPSLFDVAQSYEDHIAQYNLYEGSGATDPGIGKTHTWHPAPKPPKYRLQRKRFRTDKPLPTAPPSEAYAEISGDETEVDDTVSNRFLRRHQAKARKQARALEEPKMAAAREGQAQQVCAVTPVTEPLTPAVL